VLELGRIRIGGCAGDHLPSRAGFAPHRKLPSLYRGQSRRHSRMTSIAPKRNDVCASRVTWLTVEWDEKATKGKVDPFGLPPPPRSTLSTFVAAVWILAADLIIFCTSRNSLSSRFFSSQHYLAQSKDISGPSMGSSKHPTRSDWTLRLTTRDRPSDHRLPRGQ